LTGGPLRSRPNSRSCDRSDSHTCKWQGVPPGVCLDAGVAITGV
jgi:hypothetical protein